MDVNKALREMREAIATLREAASGDSNDAEIQAGHAVADAAEAVDGWLSTGGFLPVAWARQRQQPETIYTLAELARLLHMHPSELREGVPPGEGLPEADDEWLTAEQAAMLIKAFGPIER